MAKHSTTQTHVPVSARWVCTAPGLPALTRSQGYYKSIHTQTQTITHLPVSARWRCTAPGPPAPQTRGSGRCRCLVCFCDCEGSVCVPLQGRYRCLCMRMLCATCCFALQEPWLQLPVRLPLQLLCAAAVPRPTALCAVAAAAAAATCCRRCCCCPKLLPQLPLQPAAASAAAAPNCCHNLLPPLLPLTRCAKEDERHLQSGLVQDLLDSSKG